MAEIQIAFESQNNVLQDIKNLRSRLVVLNSEVARNNTLAQTGIMHAREMFATAGRSVIVEKRVQDVSLKSTLAFRELEEKASIASSQVQIRAIEAVGEAYKETYSQLDGAADVGAFGGGSLLVSAPEIAVLSQLVDIISDSGREAERSKIAYMQFASVVESTTRSFDSDEQLTAQIGALKIYRLELQRTASENVGFAIGDRVEEIDTLLFALEGLRNSVLSSEAEFKQFETSVTRTLAEIGVGGNQVIAGVLSEALRRAGERFESLGVSIVDVRGEMERSKVAYMQFASVVENTNRAFDSGERLNAQIGTLKNYRLELQRTATENVGFAIGDRVEEIDTLLFALEGLRNSVLSSEAEFRQFEKSVTQTLAELGTSGNQVIAGVLSEALRRAGERFENLGVSIVDVRGEMERSKIAYMQFASVVENTSRAFDSDERLNAQIETLKNYRMQLQLTSESATGGSTTFGTDESIRGIDQLLFALDGLRNSTSSSEVEFSNFQISVTRTLAELGESGNQVIAGILSEALSRAGERFENLGTSAASASKQVALGLQDVTRAAGDAASATGGVFDSGERLNSEISNLRAYRLELEMTASSLQSGGAIEARAEGIDQLISALDGLRRSTVLSDSDFVNFSMNVSRALETLGSDAVVADILPEALKIADARFESLGVSVADVRGEMERSKIAYMQFASVVENTNRAFDSGERLNAQIGTLKNYRLELQRTATENVGFATGDRVKEIDILLFALEGLRKSASLSETEFKEFETSVTRGLEELGTGGNQVIAGIVSEALSRASERFEAVGVSATSASEQVQSATLTLAQGSESVALSVTRVAVETASSVRNISLELVSLNDTLRRSRDAFKDSVNLDSLGTSAENLIRVTSEVGQAQLDQVSVQIASQQELLQSEQSTEKARAGIQQRILDLKVRSAQIEVDTAYKITGIEREEAKKRDQIVQQAAANRIASQKRVAAAERLRLLEFSEEYQRTLNEISSRSDRVQFSNVFGGLVNQGQGLEEALRSTRNFFAILEVNQNLLQNTERGLSVLVGTLTGGFSQALMQSTNLLERLTSKSREQIDAQASLNLSINSRQIEAPDISVPTIQSFIDEGQGDLNREFNQLRADQLQDEYKLIEENLNQRYRLYSQEYTRIANTVSGILTGRYESIQDAAQKFIRDLLSVFIRQEIQQRLSDVREVALNTAKANAKIANEKRVQAEVLRTAYFSQAAEGAGAVVGGIGVLGTLGILGGVLGLGALAYSAINSQNSASSSSSRVSGSRFPSVQDVQRGGEERPLNVVVEFDDGTIRAVNSRIDSNDREKRN